MNHSFNVEIAKEFGILEAVLIDNIAFWIIRNKANEENFHDGRTWMYNSVKAFQELFPYASIGQIRRALNHLVEEGILITGNFNEKQYDRTLWYAFADSAKSIFQVRQMDLSYLANAFVENEQPIPDIKPYINKDNKPDNKYSQECKDVITYLNECTGKNFRFNERNFSHIRARLSEGFTVDDLKCVVSKKTMEWIKDPHMSQYLRPQTLFAGKFESYLNQSAVKPKVGDGLPF